MKSLFCSRRAHYTSVHHFESLCALGRENQDFGRGCSASEHGPISRQCGMRFHCYRQRLLMPHIAVVLTIPERTRQFAPTIRLLIRPQNDCDSIHRVSCLSCTHLTHTDHGFDRSESPDSCDRASNLKWPLIFSCSGSHV